jgi:hypothetical protein
MTEMMGAKFLTRRRIVLPLSAWFIVVMATLIFPDGATAQTLLAVAQTPAVQANQTVPVNLAAGATVPAGQNVYIQSMSTATTHGAVSHQSGTTVVYTPGNYYASLAENSSATDQFTFCLFDTSGAISCSNVVVTISGVGSAPPPPGPTSPSGLLAARQTPAVMANQTVGVNLAAGATVPAGQNVYIQSMSTATANGVVNHQSATTVTYTPGSYYSSLAQNSTATDQFTFCLVDTAEAISCSNVVVTISGVASAAPPAPPPPPPTAPPPGSTSATSYVCLRNWYVAPNGSDNASGTTVSTPWATLQHADNTGALRAGDCVNVAPGTYPVRATITLGTGGNANAPDGYVVYRSTGFQGAKLKATGQNVYDVVDLMGDYMIFDGFEIDGGDLGLTTAPVTVGSGLVGWGHHFEALNNLVHDCGGEGVAALYKDWYWIIGNTAYNNAHFNGYQMSGISIYEARAVTFTPTAADNDAAYHIIVENNVSHDNSELFVPGAHTDGNGIILDDFQNTQSGDAPYPYNSLVQGNTTYNNGARGVHLFFTNNVTVNNNTAYNDNLDTAIDGTWRGELSNAFGSNNSWTNNLGAATSVPSDIRSYNTAVLDGHSGPVTVNVTWQNNANLDTRTGGKSYQIDNPARDAAFPLDNPLGTDP